MFHKGAVLEQTDFKGVKNSGPEAALVVNFKLYNCTYKHMDSVKHSQEPLWTLSLEFYDLLTTYVSFFFLQFPLIILIVVLYCLYGKKQPLCSSQDSRHRKKGSKHLICGLLSHCPLALRFCSDLQKVCHGQRFNQTWPSWIASEYMNVKASKIGLQCWPL